MISFCNSWIKQLRIIFGVFRGGGALWEWIPVEENKIYGVLIRSCGIRRLNLTLQGWVIKGWGPAGCGTPSICLENDFKLFNYNYNFTTI